ncbi:MAG TPA: GvpA family gas vesicle protein [Deltaproteobacteria bacterium]|nr:GvpA family gas vesicle protein [Deltaproteobacteria bacterium]
MASEGSPNLQDGSPLVDRGPAEHISLCETLDRVLNKGVVIHGDLTISVANVDLIYLGLRLLLASVETAHETGILHFGARDQAQMHAGMRQ